MIPEGEWAAWSIDGRSGAKLCLGPVFLGEISHPHDFGLGARWKAWLNQQHLGFFRTEEDARARIESEIIKRLRLMQPALQILLAHTKGAGIEATAVQIQPPARVSTLARPLLSSRRGRQSLRGRNGVMTH